MVKNLRYAVVALLVNDNHIELNLRFLTHPKKTRIIEDYLWTNILKKYKAKKINIKGIKPQTNCGFILVYIV